MQLSKASQIHLRRIDPSQNMRRFYCLTVQPTLFGGESFNRNWGRIESRGQTMMETFDLADDAELAFERLERRKNAEDIATPFSGDRDARSVFASRRDEGPAWWQGPLLKRSVAVAVRAGPDQLQAFLAFHLDEGGVNGCGEARIVQLD